MVMFGWDFEVDARFRFWRCLIKICVWTCDMTQEVTLVSRTQPSGPLCLWQCFYLSSDAQLSLWWNQLCGHLIKQSRSLSENRAPGWETSPPSNHDLVIVLEHKTAGFLTTVSLLKEMIRKESKWWRQRLSCWTLDYPWLDILHPHLIFQDTQ